MFVTLPRLELTASGIERWLVQWQTNAPRPLPPDLRQSASGRVRRRNADLVPWRVLERMKAETHGFLYVLVKN